MMMPRPVIAHPPICPEVCGSAAVPLGWSVSWKAPARPSARQSQKTRGRASHPTKASGSACAGERANIPVAEPTHPVSTTLYRA